jgi:NAD(P)-dependent dehydrogenase (short-subunit alcohol dehydrogenase family)
MDLGLTGKIALVTGSSRGIGRGIALALSDAGCDLLLTGRDREALEEVARSIRSKGRTAAVRALDLRERSAPAALVEAARLSGGNEPPATTITTICRQKRRQGTSAASRQAAEREIPVIHRAMIPPLRLDTLASPTRSGWGAGEHHKSIFAALSRSYHQVSGTPRA